MVSLPYIPWNRHRAKPASLGENVWIARDADGRLWMHFFEPLRNSTSGGSWYSPSFVDISGTPIDAKMEHLRWEDAPVAFKLSAF